MSPSRETGLAETSGTLSGSVRPVVPNPGQDGLEPIRLEASQAKIKIGEVERLQLIAQQVGVPASIGGAGKRRCRASIGVELHPSDQPHCRIAAAILPRSASLWSRGLFA